MLDYLLLPAVGFLVALLGLYTDAKEKPFGRSAVIIIVLFVATGGLTGWSAYAKEGESEVQKDQIKVQTNTILYLSALVKAVSHQVIGVSNKLDDMQPILRTAAEYFGMRLDRASPENVATGLLANSALNQIATPGVVETNAKILVKYYPHQLDQEVITNTLVSSLSKLGFEVKPGVPTPNTILMSLPTNCVAYGPQVPVEAVRSVALTLIQAGIGIRGILPLPEKSAKSKANRIEIGTWQILKDRPPLSVEAVTTKPLAQLAG